MASMRKAAGKAVRAPRAVCSAKVVEQAAQLRAKAATERHGGTALEQRVAALELQVAELVKVRI